MRGSRALASCRVGASRGCGRRLGARDATANAEGARRRGGAGERDRAARQAIRPLWLSAHSPVARRRRLAGQRQARSPNLAPGRAESPKHAAETWRSVAQRQIARSRMMSCAASKLMAPLPNPLCAPRHGPSGANLLFAFTVSTSRRCRHRIRTRIKSHIDSSVCDCYWYGR